MGIFDKVKKMGKKAQGVMGAGNMILTGAIIVIVLIFVITVGASLVQNVGDTQAVGSAAKNISGKGLTAFLTFGDYFGTIVQVFILIAILALLVGVLAYSFMRQQ